MKAMAFKTSSFCIKKSVLCNIKSVKILLRIHLIILPSHFATYI